ncbi:hypothetical protein [Halobacteriovorax sp. HLS]|uniref:hypothetical protein n=1 Tax=Halobacteriovorax sp. HLS TaxID=2234000 RepID=UPI000FD9D184|nr:hypothetical protein [Halobacteriovorax sp. HLS]
MNKTALIILSLLTTSALAKVRDQGEVTFENRVFERDNNNLTYDDNFALYARAQVEFEEGSVKGVLSAYGRADSKDRERNQYIIEDAYGAYTFGESEDFKIVAGWKLFNWSSLEAFHPADVVNSKNYDGEIENLEKKGELTLEAQYVVGQGTLNLYYWPRVENPVYPSTRSRTGVNFGVPFKDPVWVNGNDAGTNSKWQPQYGVRFNQTVEDLDFSVHFLDHFDRSNPMVGYTFGTQLGAVEVPADPTDFRPHFYRVQEVGGTMTYAYDSALFKLEGSVRFFENEFKTLIPLTTTTFVRDAPEDHSEVAFGYEQVLSFEEIDHEITLIFEVSSIFGVSKDKRRRLGTFQRDALLGMRYNFNDTMGSELFTSIIQDLEYSDERLVNISFTRRLSDNWKYQTGLRVYQAKERGFYGMQIFKGDSYAFLNISRFF